MIIGSALTTKGVQGIFNKALEELYINDAFMNAATRIDSKTNQETYAWLDMFPQVREWIGSKIFNSAKNYSYTLVNKDWEGSIEIDRNELADDQTGSIAPRIQTLAMMAKKKMSDLLSDLLINGTSSTAYDAVAFFSNTSGVRLIDNLLAGTGTTAAQVEADLASARAAMMKFYFIESTNPMGFTLDTIVCPPELEITFLKLKESTTAVSDAGGNVVNPFRSMIKNVIADPRLSDANDWYGLCTSYPIRPLILQVRQDPTFVAQDKPESESNFLYRKLRYSAEGRYNAGYAFPHMAVKVVNT